MSTLSEETPEGGNQRRKSMGSGSGGSNLAGGKARRYSIGATSSRKSIGEEGNIIPNYLRASTGSCHDFCKFGKKHEQSKSAIPIKFKRTTNVNTEKASKTVVPLERKKTTTATKPEPSAEPIEVTKKDVLLPSKKPQGSKRVSSTNGKATENEVKALQQSTSHVKLGPVRVNPDGSSGSNGGIKKKDIKTAKKSGITPKITPVNKVVPKSTLKESQSPKASFGKAASSKGMKYTAVKQVSPLKDKNRMQKTGSKQTIADEIQTKTLHVVEADPEVKPETMEFEIVHPLMESINDPVSNSSESFLGEKDVQEDSLISHQLYESSEHFSDKELLEETLIAPVVVESAQSCSDKEVLEEESLIAPAVSESSESYYEEEVSEDEFEYTDDDEEEVFEEGSETVNVNEMETLVGNHDKISRNGRKVLSEEKDNEAVKLRFRRGKILELQSENNGPRRLKFRRRVIEGNEDGQNITRRSSKNKTSEIKTEVNVPRRLKFTKGKVMGSNEDEKRIARRSFEKKFVEKTNESNNGPESVVLKHQGEQGKKDAQGLFNNVIEETASKLVESRKSKVKALVGAFETVISLQDGKPTST